MKYEKLIFSKVVCRIGVITKCDWKLDKIDHTIKCYFYFFEKNSINQAMASAGKKPERKYMYCTAHKNNYEKTT